MESSEVYRKRVDALTKRKAEVAAQRDVLQHQRAELIKAGQDTGDTWLRIQGCEQELHALDRELNELGNLASDAYAAEQLRADRAEFQAANRSLSGKRGQLYRMRDEAIAAVNAAADRLQKYVRELDELERQQAARADALNGVAQALGEPADFALPDNTPPNLNLPYSRPDVKTFATAKVMNTARRHDRRDYLAALAEAAFVNGQS